MQKKQVAVIDVGSSKITAIIGERGINKTFIIKGRYSFDYDGFANGEFFNLKQLKQVLNSVADCIIKGSLEKIETVYVGVPGDFTRVYIRDSQLSFPKKRKIVEEDVDALFDSAFVMTSAKYTFPVSFVGGRRAHPAERVGATGDLSRADTPDRGHRDVPLRRGAAGLILTKEKNGTPVCRRHIERRNIIHEPPDQDRA